MADVTPEKTYVLRNSKNNLFQVSFGLTLYHVNNSTGIY